jgi:hypothetical protein
MRKITAPVKGFNGVVGGVQFTDGEAETDSPSMTVYFRRHGYQAEDAEKTLEQMKVDELKAYADSRDIDLGDATKKADILAAIQAAEKE